VSWALIDPGSCFTEARVGTCSATINSNSINAGGLRKQFFSPQKLRFTLALFVCGARPYIVCQPPSGVMCEIELIWVSIFGSFRWLQSTATSNYSHNSRRRMVWSLAFSCIFVNLHQFRNFAARWKRVGQGFPSSRIHDASVARHSALMWPSRRLLARIAHSIHHQRRDSSYCSFYWDLMTYVLT